MRAVAIIATLALAGCGQCGSSPSTVTVASPLDASSPPRTPPGPGVTRIIVGGDSRDDEAHVVPWAFHEARARQAVAFFFLGDMELSPELDRSFARELMELDPVPFYPILGNHEVEQLGFLPIGRKAAEKVLVHHFLGTARTPVRSALPDRMVYSVDLPGGVHFVGLDNVTEHGFGAEQLAWLDADLKRAHADAATKHILVGMHKPLAHNGVTTHGMDGDGPQALKDSDAALASMAASHVELILASHAHELARFDQAGIRTYITGGLGAPLAGKAGPEHAFHHFLQVDLSDAGAHVEVVRFPGAPSMAPAGEDDDDDAPKPPP